MNSLNFDSIIYSANFAGVVAASILKLKNQHVLLLNRYGFFGGTITESLNLFQRKIYKNSDNSALTHKILKEISNDKDGILYENDIHLIFNPEVVKYALQKIVEENKIELLFHITPYKVEYENEQIRLSVFGREGIIKLNCKYLFDFSTEFTFAPLIDISSRTFDSAFVNFITLPVNNEKVFDNVFIKKKLKDDRWWISVKNEADNLFEIEESAQNIFDRFDDQLRKHKGRIQIVPAQSNLIFNFKKSEKFKTKIFFIKDFIDNFNYDDEIIIAQKIEETIQNDKSL